MVRQFIASSLCIVITLTCATSCVDIEEYDNTTYGNMKALWTIMDEHYCFFEEKERALGVNWEDIGAQYSQQANKQLSQKQEFELLCRMVGELRDGHVNLSSPFDYGRNWSWKEDYPANFSDSLQRRYLGTDYKISNGIYYKILGDNIGYIYAGTFEYTIGDGNLDEIIYHLLSCNGLIIDIRNNGGGLLTEAKKLAARFCNEKTFVGYMSHKNGPEHNDFSEKKEQWIEPSAGIRWQKKVCVLTNRSVFSAANEFTKYMKQMPLATVIGDTTGGGAGMPFSAELPNGWGVRFSACPMYDIDGKSTEQGIEPDMHVEMTDEDMRRNQDGIIEAARAFLKE